MCVCCVADGNLGLTDVEGGVFAGLGTVAIQDSATSALTLICVSAILGAFSLIVHKTRSCLDTYARAVRYNILTFFTCTAVCARARAFTRWFAC